SLPLAGWAACPPPVDPAADGLRDIIPPPPALYPARPRFREPASALLRAWTHCFFHGVHELHDAVVQGGDLPLVRLHLPPEAVDFPQQPDIGTQQNSKADGKHEAGHGDASPPRG